MRAQQAQSTPAEMPTMTEVEAQFYALQAAAGKANDPHAEMGMMGAVQALGWVLCPSLVQNPLDACLTGGVQSITRSTESA